MKASYKKTCIIFKAKKKKIDQHILKTKLDKLEHFK